MIEVICKQCTARAFVTDGRDVHEAVVCACCPEPHHHGQAAGGCPRDHEGPCWQGPQSGPRPDGCTVCRPLMVMAMAGVVPVRG